jgi:hypothetical protein
MNASGGIPYDQIALILSPAFTQEPGDSGVIDYFQFVYTDEQAESYKADSIEILNDNFSRQRTYWMSDHLPKWITLRINEDGE